MMNDQTTCSSYDGLGFDFDSDLAQYQLSILINHVQVTNRHGGPFLVTPLKAKKTIS